MGSYYSTNLCLVIYITGFCNANDAIEALFLLMWKDFIYYQKCVKY